VYISEAHAIDEWPVGDGYGKLKGFKQPKTLEERIRVAKEFIGDFDYGVPMVCDSMENKFDSIFACWPVRYYILHQGGVYYKAQPNAKEYTYSVDDLRQALATLTGRSDLRIQSSDDQYDYDGTLPSSSSSSSSCTASAGCSSDAVSSTSSCSSGVCSV